MTEFYVVLGVIGAVAFTWVHAQVFPLKVCPSCGGTGERGHGPWRAVCRRCGGSKRVRRWLAPDR